jgi:arylsulfatase
VHLDGFNQLPYLTGEAKDSPRQHFFYVSDDGDLTALRYDNWKIVFAEQRATGTLRVWGAFCFCVRLLFLSACGTRGGCLNNDMLDHNTTNHQPLPNQHPKPTTNHTNNHQKTAEPYTYLRVPKIFNLRLDPYERADTTSNTYYDWLIDHAWVMVPAQAYVAKMIATLKDFPPRQEPASFTVTAMLQKLQAGMPSS